MLMVVVPPENGSDDDEAADETREKCIPDDGPVVAAETV